MYCFHSIQQIGRTARIGHSGEALLFLMPSEDQYLHLLQNQKKMTLYNTEAEEILKTLQTNYESTNSFSYITNTRQRQIGRVQSNDLSLISIANPQRNPEIEISSLQHRIGVIIEKEKVASFSLPDLILLFPSLTLLSLLD